MRVTIIGTGYVGLITGVCLAELGHSVTGFVRDSKKMGKLRAGVPTLYEEGLAQMLRRNLKAGRLRFTDEFDAAVRAGQVIFIAVGTPMSRSGAADLTAVFDVSKRLARVLKPATVVVVKSTVPPGTTERAQNLIRRMAKNRIPFSIANNPEFLREGTSIRDFLQPDRIVVGTQDAHTANTLKRLYRPLTRQGYPLLVTDIRSSETIKYASNAFLAMKISYINEIANFAEKVGGNITDIARGIGMDSRINPKFLNAGIGYGGSCFPKDVRALIHAGRRIGANFKLLPAVERVNSAQQRVLLKKLRVIYPSLKGKTIALWGLSYKPGTDDVRDAPSLVIIRELLKAGAYVQAHDPAAMPAIHRLFPRVQLSKTPNTAANKADALLLLTEWKAYAHPNFQQLKKVMRRPIIVDGRNFLNALEARSCGFSYFGIGKRDPNSC